MGPASSGGYEQSGREQGGAMGALGREVGRRSVERLGSGLTRIVEESSALYRWMLTMLVLLNAAAIYAAISARDAMGAEMFSQLVLLFFAGLMAALLAALAGMALTLPVAGSIRRAITHWTDVSLTGALSGDALASAKHVRLIGTIWLSVISAIALVSLLLFLMGAAIMAKQFGVIGGPQDGAPALEAAIEDAPVANAVQALPEPQANAASALPAPARSTSPAPRVAEPKRSTPRQQAAPSRPASTTQRAAPAPAPKPAAAPVVPPAPVRPPAPAAVPSSPPVIVVPPSAPPVASPD